MNNRSKLILNYILKFGNWEFFFDYVNIIMIIYD